MIPLAVAGAAGRMGRQVLAAAFADPRFTVVGGLVRPGNGLAGQDLGVLAGAGPRGVPASEDPNQVLADARVLIDFSQAAATVAYAEAAATRGCAFLTGTTGLAPDQVAAVRKLGRYIPVLIAANTSVGLAALLRLLPTLAAALGPDYDIEIVETHHRHKADAPSGTALAIANLLAGATGAPLAERGVYGRQGRASRRPGEIGVHAVRAGGAVGEHRIVLASEGEQLEILHRATSRQTYAAGALRAAAWLAGQPAGVYGMDAVLDA